MSYISTFYKEYIYNLYLQWAEVENFNLNGCVAVEARRPVELWDGVSVAVDLERQSGGVVFLMFVGAF